MLDQKKVFDALTREGVDFYAGVPDSYLDGFCKYALAHFEERTVIAANEGNAVAIAAGRYMATKKIPLVFLQNSGQGITVNPLVSLCDPAVYAIPVILLVGWRGQGNSEPKHPQHKLQGEITPRLFEIMHIPCAILSDDDAAFGEILKTAAEYCRAHRAPYALIAPKGVMAEKDKENVTDGAYPMSREEAIEAILDALPPDTVYCATTGRATRELYFLRERRGEGHEHDFLNVGSMGHASSVALGIALSRPERLVATLDGDAACMMHMGALTHAARYPAPNHLHIVLNNGAHESVGGQKSAGQLIDLTAVAAACGFNTVGAPVTTKEELLSALRKLKGGGKSAFLDVRIHCGLRGKLPPLDFDHRAAADALIDELNGEKSE